MRPGECEPSSRRGDRGRVYHRPSSERGAYDADSQRTGVRCDLEVSPAVHSGQLRRCVCLAAVMRFAGGKSERDQQGKDEGAEAPPRAHGPWLTV
jgi:hypothetical protein